MLLLPPLKGRDYRSAPLCHDQHPFFKNGSSIHVDTIDLILYFNASVSFVSFSPLYLFVSQTL